MSFNWYLSEELGRERLREDQRKAEHSRLVKEALAARNIVGWSQKAIESLGVLMVKAGRWMQKKASVQKAIDSILEASDQNKQVCETC